MEDSAFSDNACFCLSRDVKEQARPTAESAADSAKEGADQAAGQAKGGADKAAGHAKKGADSAADAADRKGSGVTEESAGDDDEDIDKSDEGGEGEGGQSTIGWVYNKLTGR